MKYVQIPSQAQMGRRFTLLFWCHILAQPTRNLELQVDNVFSQRIVPVNMHIKVLKGEGEGQKVVPHFGT
jgi:hypothetical protein